MKKLSLYVCQLSLALLVVLFSVFAIHAQTTIFSYQGRMTDGSDPSPTGQYDLQFNLYDEPIGSNLPLNATPIVLEDVQVTDGEFTVSVDFGNLFDGNNRYLEIGQRPGNSTGAFTVLNPRQQITSTPYAIRSLSAATADAATNAQNLGGTASSNFVQSTDSRLTDARTPTAGSSNYIQNTSSAQPGVSFNIGGTGTAGVLNAATQFNIGGNRVLSVAGARNIFVGNSAGAANTTATDNSFFGYQSGNSNTIGTLNSFFGSQAGADNTAGNGNSFFGSQAGFHNTGSLNTFVGKNSGNFNRGSSNSFFGYAVGFNNSTGTFNSFFGSHAGSNNTTGIFNSFFGISAGNDNTTGSNNTMIGANAGLSGTTGSNNTIIGADANASSANISFATAVGSKALVTTSDTIILGKVAGTYDGVSRPADTVRIPGSLNVTGTISGNINGASFTNLNASNIISGTLDNARLGVIGVANGGTGLTSAGTSGNFLRSNGTGFTSSALTITDIPAGNANYIQNTTAQQANANLNISGNGVVGGNLSVNGALNASGSGLTNLNAANITTGTLDNARLGAISTANIADSAITAAKIGSNQVVKNLNGLTDTVTLAAGANVTITPSGNSLTISAAGGNFIQNTTTQQPGSDFNISGSGTAGGTLSGNIVNATTQFNINGNAVLSVAGTGNIFAGSGAGNNNTTGLQNSFFGKYAGTHNTVGYGNSLVGYAAGYSHTTGLVNSFFGDSSGYNTTSGNSNSFFGVYAGGTNTTGSQNTIIGANANVGSNNLSYATALGADATVSTNNTVVLGRSAGQDMVLISGLLRLNTLGTGGGSQLCHNASNQISNCSSSLRYKTNVAPFSFGLNLVQRLRPITFMWKDGAMADLGFGAEEVEKINPLFVTYNGKGQVEGVKYDRLSVVFVNAFKEQQTQIEAQQTQLKQQQGQIEAQQKQLKQQQTLIDGLKKLVCQQNPTADVCQ